MYSASIGGGKGKRQNQVKQAKEYAEAMKKKNEAESSSGTLNKLTFQEMLGIINTIIRDWSSDDGLIIGEVIDQGKRDICWAICFARLLQAIFNTGRPANQHEEFSFEELIDHIKPKGAENFALANLKIAIKHIKDYGIMKVPASGHKSQTADAMGKRVKHTFELYEDVDAAHIRARLNKYPVGLIVQLDPKFLECKGVYYLPKKMVITNETCLHCIILIGYGETKDGKLFFIGQNSHGDTWGCKGYFQIFNNEKCDIICTKEQI